MSFAAKDRVAFASASTTGFSAVNTDRSPLSYAVEACVSAIKAAGIEKAAIDGIIGSSNPAVAVLQQALGIPAVTFFANPPIPIGNQLAMAVGAIHAGLCNVALVYHASYRLPWNTGAAARDPFRRGGGGIAVGGLPESVNGAVGYTAWASRYLAETKATRDDFGLVAVNGRTNAGRNPAAAKRDPITLDDYRNARMIREPLCMLDMDVAVDGADAFIITSTERARDMALPPVLIHGVTLGMTGRADEAQTPSLEDHGQHVVLKALRDQCDFWIDDIDVFFPYDGFSIITLNWIENAGYCKRGEAGDFLRSHWDGPNNRALINGRVPINPHGGSLSEGATQGSGHVREAVHQLQGLAGPRQVENAQRALLTPGGFFFNSQGAMLRRE